MPYGCFSCLPCLLPPSITPPRHESEPREPATPLVEDFARAQQAAARASVATDSLALFPAHARSPGAATEPAALAPIPVSRRSSAPASSRPSTVDAPVFTVEMCAGSDADRARHIFDTLWRDVAIPALRALGTPPVASGWRDQLEQLRHAWSDDPPEPGSPATYPWHDTLQAHLHRQAWTLARHGFDVADVTDRIAALLSEERPDFSWRSFCIGTARDALPFAFGSTLVSLLAESTDPTRSQAWLWPPLSALGVVLINLLGMAGFNATQGQFRNRIVHTTPAPGLEGLSAILSTPYRAAFAQVIGFVFCYGVLRNGARYGIERAVSHWLPGMLTQRFGDTLHAALEIPLTPIPGLLLLPIIHQLGTTRQSASLQILMQNNFTELIDAVGREAAPEDWPACRGAFFRNISGMLRATPPRLLWFALTLTFYYLAWMGEHAAPTENSSHGTQRDDPVHNGTQAAPEAHSPSAAQEAHVFAVLDVLYGVIGLIFSIGHTAVQREDLRTAHERRGPRPKISTCTVVTTDDSDAFSGSPSLMGLNSAGTRDVNNNMPAASMFPFPVSLTAQAALPPAAGEPYDDAARRGHRPPGVRRHGTATVPGTLRAPQGRPWWRSAGPEEADDDAQQSTPL